MPKVSLDATPNGTKPSNKHCKKYEDAIVGEVSGSDIETVEGRGKEVIEYEA
jgi:hypothetical protein